jgi:arsenate reductase (thioredoxin)
VGLQLLENSLATGAALVALILALQPVSAAFNPVVTLVERGFGAGQPDVRAGAGHLRHHPRRRAAVAYAVGGYITAAYWFTSSTSFANPAVAIARVFSDTFAGIAPASVPMFVLMQLLGGAAAFGLIKLLYPRSADWAVHLAHPGERTAVTDKERTTVSDRPTVLFVCVHNAGRSQMASALLDLHAQGKVNVLSAGSEPAERINPAVVEVMNELHLDLSEELPKPLTDESVQAADVVITMGCGDACPYYPGRRYLDWEIEDPARKDVDTVRRIRDDIDARVRALLGELSPG